MIIYHAKVLLIDKNGWDGPEVIKATFNLPRACEKYTYEIYFEAGLTAKEQREPIIIIREK